MKQRSFASLSFEVKKKPTRREKFLGVMEQVVAWSELQALIEPSYPTAGRRGRPARNGPNDALKRYASPV